MCAHLRFWQTRSDGRAKGAQHAAHGTSRRLPSCRIPQPERQRAYARSTTARARAKSSTRRAIVGHFMRARAIPAPHARLSPMLSGLCHVHPVPMLLSAFSWWRGNLARLTPPPRHHLVDYPKTLQPPRACTGRLELDHRCRYALDDRPRDIVQVRARAEVGVGRVCCRDSRGRERGGAASISNTSDVPSRARASLPGHVFVASRALGVSVASPRGGLVIW